MSYGKRVCIGMCWQHYTATSVSLSERDATCCEFCRHLRLGERLGDRAEHDGATTTCVLHLGHRMLRCEVAEGEGTAVSAEFDDRDERVRVNRLCLVKVPSDRVLAILVPG